MCFSAEASFLAGFGLLSSSFYFLRKPIKQEYLFLKIIPLLFGLQQLCEGIVWVTYMNPTYSAVTTFFKYAFLFYAFFLWPMYVPFSLIFATHGIYKTIQLVLTGVGIAVSGTLAWLSYCYGVNLHVSCNHIEYFFPIAECGTQFLAFLYLITTIGSFFFTHNKKLMYAGLLIGASALMSWYVFTVWFTSVWCFFAAVVSSYIFLL